MVGAVSAAALRGARAVVGGVSATGVWEELEAFGNDFEFAAFLACLFIFPGVHLEAAFDEAAAASGEVLLGEFSLASPESDIDVGSFFLFFVALVEPSAIDREGDVGDGGSFGGVAQFGISSEISEEEYFV